MIRIFAMGIGFAWRYGNACRDGVGGRSAFVTGPICSMSGQPMSVWAEHLIRQRMVTRLRLYLCSSHNSLQLKSLIILYPVHSSTNRTH
jgi:hypothetical protein